MFDLRPSERPILVPFDVPPLQVVDAVSDAGVQAAGLRLSYASLADRSPCRAIAAKAVREGLDGVASRSAAETTATSWVGEELALFDTQPLPKPAGRALTFTKWYPGPRP